MTEATDLAARRCKPGAAPMGDAQIRSMLARLSGWVHRDGVIAKEYTFPDYGQTIAFVAATAWVSHREDHHPEITVGYNTCRVEYCTHDIRGLSENDFICAAKLDALFAL
jgi:4a-hydroxytetrahydrobiopterin dehydratase